MNAHSPINTSTEIRQSESNRFGWVVVAGGIVGWILVSIAGGSRLRAAPEFIAGIFIIRECGDGALPRPGGAEPRYHTTSVRGDPAGNTGVRHFPVNLKNSRHRIRPGKSLRLVVAAFFHARAEGRIKQRSLQSSPDLKHVFRSH